MINDEGWRFQANGGFDFWQTDGQTNGHLQL